MNKIRRIGTSRIAITALAAVMASAGAAIAAGGGNSGNSERGGPPPGHGMMGGPGMQGGKYLTYAEAHSYRNGKETVTRTDAGKFKSATESEITITERDGNDVTIAISEDTEVLIPDNEEATVSDLTVGKRVIVTGEKGQAADVVAVAPARGMRPSRPHGATTG
ncbi:MAG: hypothetical protein HY827_08085 [Actinobacteria bacterium]|nr:hypothetical protein [Actinomycetota bacterium]